VQVVGYLLLYFTSGFNFVGSRLHKCVFASVARVAERTQRSHTFTDNGDRSV